MEFYSYELWGFIYFFDPFTLYAFFFDFALSFFVIDEVIWRLSLLEFLDWELFLVGTFCCESNFLDCLSEFFSRRARLDDV